MLFYTPNFIFLFLPIALLGYYGLGKIHNWGTIVWLAAVSLFFYGYWNTHYLYLVGCSIILNYVAGTFIEAMVSQKKYGLTKLVRNLAITINLGILFYFKYLIFGLEQIQTIFQAHLTIPNILLPIGISFYTFTQIAYLIDLSRGLVKHSNFIKYVLFVSYFPHLIAGPILHHSEMMPQFTPSTAKFNVLNFSKGITFFAFGLFKKVVIADSVATFVGPVFDAHSTFGPADAWVAAISYTLQLYYDFSGYSDMAVGISLMFNVELPINFYSPYKSKSIIEFWRRWHMTLSRFLRDYLYFGLGGNKKGPARRYFNLVLTMLLGGFWHGANWTFVAWGGLHAFYLIVNHIWRLMPGCKRITLHPIISICVTFTCTVVAWVLFRAPDIGTAMNILHSMVHIVQNPKPKLVSWGEAQWIALLLAWTFFAPNTNEIMNYRFGMDAVSIPDGRAIQWNQQLGWAVAVGTVLFVTAATGMMARQSLAFLYFQF